MAKRKENSTNSINRSFLENFCGVNYAIDLIGGRWKLSILYKLDGKNLRFSEIKRHIPHISDRVLSRQLLELEQAGLINRSVFAEVPVKVVYTLSESGAALSPIWKSLEKWGHGHKESLDRIGKKDVEMVF